MQKDIRHTWQLDYPPTTVWKFLTDSELLSQWLMENDFKPIMGHKFQFKTYPRVKLGFDGIVYCEVLEVLPNERLSYSWKGGPGNGKIHLNSVVTWILTPTPKGTELRLEHTGFKGFRNYLSFIIMNKGWEVKIKNRILALLKKHADEHKVA